MVFVVAAVFGVFIPLGVWPYVRKSSKILSGEILLFVGFIILQIISEAVIALFGIKYLIKYTALIFVSYRLIQLVFFQKSKTQLSKFSPLQKIALIAIYFANWTIWSFVWLNLIRRVFFI